MSQDILETREYRGCTIKTYHDNCADSPRVWDNLGIIVGSVKSYTICDEENVNAGYCGSYWQDFLAYINTRYDVCSDEDGFTLDTTELQDDHFEQIENWVNKNITYLPVYLYDHSGITIRTTPFSCKWDSGQVGYIFCDQEMLNKMGTPSNHAERVLTQEIKIYDEYIRGEVYGVVIEDPAGNEIDGVWGIYGADPENEEDIQNKIIDEYLEGADQIAGKLLN